MSTGDCLAAIASARNERGAAGLVAGAVVIGGLTVAPAALSALASCTANPACLGTLPTLLGELTLGASGATAGSTFVTLGAAGAGLTGKLLLQNGDEILGVLDTVTGQTLRYVGTSASGRALVQTAEGGVGIFDDVGRLVTRENIISLPKGQRPDPSTYLSQAEIDAHLSLFDDGAIRITPTANVSSYGNAGPNGGFVLPKSELDRLITETGGDPVKLEQALGLNPGDLSSGQVSILEIAPEHITGLRIPSGNEAGANSNWVPGGYTSGGVPEAVMDLSAITEKDFTVLELLP